MPFDRKAGRGFVIAGVLAIGCQVQDQGLDGPAAVQEPTAPPPSAPGGAGGSGEVTRPPSMDPPAVAQPPAMPPVDPVPPPGPGVSVPVDQPVLNPACVVPRLAPFPMRLQNPNVESDEVAFDTEGRLLVIRDSDVVMLGGAALADPILRSVFGPEGGALRFLADGSLLVADFTGNRITRYALPGRRELFRADTLSPMKMVMGPQGRLYASSGAGFIYLVNTVTGARQVAATADAEVGGLAFSPDYRTLYAGLLRDQSIAAFSVGPQGQLGPRTTLARAIPYPLGLAADECGNLYTSGAPDGDIRRINPAGRVEVVVQTDRPQLWGMAFGSGKHGWSDTALYLTSDSDGNRGLFEIQVGLRSAPPPPGDPAR
jgi:sugar lactone lactonase YvrE